MDSTFTDLPNRTLVTPAEAAEFLRCGKSKIYYMIQFSALDAIRVNGIIRIKRDSLVRLIHPESS